MASIFIILFGLVTAIHLIGCVGPYPVVRNVTKVFLMPLLLGFYVASIKEPSALVIAALVLSWLGDIFLIVPRKPVLFILGASSFGAAHIMYVVALSRTVAIRQVRTSTWVIVAFVLLAVVSAVYVYLRRYLPDLAKIVVIAYSLLIASMAFFAVLRMIVAPILVSLLSLIGAVLFIISDTVLATNIFGKKTIQKDFVVMSTYITAQSLLVSSFML